MRKMLLVAALLLAGPAWGQEPDAEHRARAEDTARRMMMVIRALPCAPPGLVSARDMGTAVAMMGRQFESDTGGAEYWRGWIRGAMIVAVMTADMPSPPRGSPECAATLQAAGRIIEEAWARERLARPDAQGSGPPTHR